MRKYFILILFLSILSFQFSICSAKADKQTVVLSCNIHCQGCIDRIMKNIAFERGVKDIVCDLKTKTVTVTYDANKTGIPALLTAFDKIGKPATVKQSSLPQSTSTETPSTQKQASASLKETDATTSASSPHGE